MKIQPTTQAVLLFGYAVGLIAGLLVPMLFEMLAAQEISWSGLLAIFTGPLGAILGGYVAAFWIPPGPERKQLTDSLFPKLCILVGVTVAFWVPAVVTTLVFVRNDGENAVLGIIYGLCAGALTMPLGVLAGKYLAQYLMKVGSEKDRSG